MDSYARNRFKRGMALSEAEVLAFEDYFYHIMAAPGSGEHALRQGEWGARPQAPVGPLRLGKASTGRPLAWSQGVGTCFVAGVQDCCSMQGERSCPVSLMKRPLLWCCSLAKAAACS